MKYILSLFTLLLSFNSLAHAECISTPSDFDKIRNNLDGDFHLCADIDMTGIKFISIGSNDAPFTGTLNGLGRTISNLNLEKQGIFTKVSGTIAKPVLIQALLLENITLSSFMEGPVGILFGESAGTLSLENISLNGAIITPDDRLLIANSVGGLGGKVSPHPNEPWENNQVTFRMIQLQNIELACTPERIYQNSGGLFGNGITELDYILESISAKEIKASGCKSLLNTGFLVGKLGTTSRYNKILKTSINQIEVKDSIFSATELNKVGAFGQVVANNATYDLSVQNISLDNNQVNALKDHWTTGWLIADLSLYNNVYVTAHLENISAINNHLQLGCGSYSGLFGFLGLWGNEEHVFILNGTDLQDNNITGDFSCNEEIRMIGSVGMLGGNLYFVDNAYSESTISNIKIQNSTVDINNDANNGTSYSNSMGAGNVFTKDSPLTLHDFYLIDNKIEVDAETITDLGGVFGLISDYENSSNLTINRIANIGPEIKLNATKYASSIGGIVGVAIEMYMSEIFVMPSEQQGRISIHAGEYMYDIGGFIGHSLYSEILDSYSLIPLNSIAPEIRYVGGFDGESSNKIIARSYAISEFYFDALETRCIGEFSGEADAIDASFWLNMITDPNHFPGAGCTDSNHLDLKGLSGPEFMDRSTFNNAGWSIGNSDDIWNIEDGKSLPYLNFLPIPIIPDNKQITSDAIQNLKNKSMLM